MGEILGDEDCSAQRAREETVRCVSVEGELLEMKAETFIRHAKKLDASWAAFVSHVSKNESERTTLLDFAHDLPQWKCIVRLSPS